MNAVGHCTEIEPLLETATREELIELARAAADAVDRQGSEIELLKTALDTAVDCARRSVASEERMYMTVEAVAKGLDLVTDLKSRGQSRAAAEAMTITREYLTEITRLGCLAVPVPEIDVRN